jgi:hypothetical protein
MATKPVISQWHGWADRYQYDHADPFSYPVPAPTNVGIFDNPVRTVCFNPAYAPILLGALSRLEYPELYISDGYEVTQQIALLKNIIAGQGDNPCVPESILETECAYYPSWFAGIEYIPSSPFGGEVPENYLVAPFFRFSAIDTIFPNWLEDWFFNAIEWATGYRENDIFTSFFSLPTYDNPFDGLDYPTIKITVQGTGKVRLKLLAVPFGGRALISFDPVGVFDILNAVFSENDRIVELNRDVISLVPETDLDEIEEILLTEDGIHEIYITYLPTINDETPIFQFGGGFRGYEVCGNLTVIDQSTGLPLDPNGDTLQEGVILTTYEDMLRALNEHKSLDSKAWLFGADTQSGTIDSDVIDGTLTLDASSDTVTKVGSTVGGSGAVLPDGVSTVDQYFGGTQSQADNFNDLFTFIKDSATSGLSTAVIQRSVRGFMGILDDASVEAGAVNLLVTDYVAQATAFVFDGVEIAQDIFFDGSPVGGIFQFTLDNLASVDTEFNLVNDFAKYVTDTTWNTWFNKGTSKPKQDYKNDIRYIRENVVLTLDDNTLSNFGTGDESSLLSPPTLVASRDYLMKVVGLLTSTNGVDTYDGMYTVIGGVEAYDPLQFGASNGTSKVAPDVVPNYSLDGYLVNISPTNVTRLITGKRISGWTGSLTVTMIDLGAS